METMSRSSAVHPERGLAVKPTALNPSSRRVFLVLPESFFEIPQSDAARQLLRLWVPPRTSGLLGFLVDGPLRNRDPFAGVREHDS